jgi:hypothetical protein
LQLEKKYQRVCRDVAIELKDIKLPAETLLPAGSKPSTDASESKPTEATSASETATPDAATQTIVDNLKAYKVRTSDWFPRRRLIDQHSIENVDSQNILDSFTGHNPPFNLLGNRGYGLPDSRKEI